MLVLLAPQTTETPIITIIIGWVLALGLLFVLPMLVLKSYAYYRQNLFSSENSSDPILADKNESLHSKPELSGCDTSDIATTIQAANQSTSAVIRNCSFAFECDKKWTDLKESASSTVRMCDSCNRLVFFCRTPQELQSAIFKNQCVAVEIPDPRNQKTTMKLGEPFAFESEA